MDTGYLMFVFGLTCVAVPMTVMLVVQATLLSRENTMLQEELARRDKTVRQLFDRLATWHWSKDDPMIGRISSQLPPSVKEEMARNKDNPKAGGGLAKPSEGEPGQSVQQPTTKGLKNPTEGGPKVVDRHYVG